MKFIFVFFIFNWGCGAREPSATSDPTATEEEQPIAVVSQPGKTSSSVGSGSVSSPPGEQKIIPVIPTALSSPNEGSEGSLGEAENNNDSPSSQTELLRPALPRIKPVRHNSTVKSVTVKGFVFFAGGNVLPEINTDRIEVYEEKTGEWSVLYMPKRVAVFALTGIGSKVILAGGYKVESTGKWASDPATFNSVASDDVQIYDVDSKTWSFEKLSVSRANSSAVTVGQKLVILGGSNPNTGYSTQVDIFDAATSTWSNHQLTTPYSNREVSVIGNKAYFLFGQGYFATQQIAQVYDAELDSWSDMVVPYSIHGTVATMKDKAIIIPHISDSGRYRQASVLQNGIVSSMQNSPYFNRVCSSSASTGNFSFFSTNVQVGDASQMQNKIMKYDDLTQTWDELALSEHRECPQMAVIGTKVIFFGGYVPGSYLPGRFPEYGYFSDVIDIYDTETKTLESSVAN